MTADDVLEVLAALTGLGVVVDGGWGVDALVGEQTRAHGDLDLVVPVERVAEALDRLQDAGFEVVRDLLPTSIAFRDERGREVDLHLVESTEDGGGVQDLTGDPGWHGVPAFRYGPPASGRIGDVEAACVDPGTRRRAHAGDALREVDLQDLARLDALG